MAWGHCSLHMGMRNTLFLRAILCAPQLGVCTLPLPGHGDTQHACQLRFGPHSMEALLILPSLLPHILIKKHNPLTLHLLLTLLNMPVNNLHGDMQKQWASCPCFEKQKDTFLFFSIFLLSQPQEMGRHARPLGGRGMPTGRQHIGGSGGLGWQ